MHDAPPQGGVFTEPTESQVNAIVELFQLGEQSGRKDPTTIFGSMARLYVQEYYGIEKYGASQDVVNVAELSKQQIEDVAVSMLGVTLDAIDLLMKQRFDVTDSSKVPSHEVLDRIYGNLAEASEVLTHRSRELAVYYTGTLIAEIVANDEPALDYRFKENPSLEGQYPAVKYEQGVLERRKRFRTNIFRLNTVRALGGICRNYAFLRQSQAYQEANDRLFSEAKSFVDDYKEILKNSQQLDFVILPEGKDEGLTTERLHAVFGDLDTGDHDLDFGRMNILEEIRKSRDPGSTYFVRGTQIRGSNSEASIIDNGYLLLVMQDRQPDGSIVESAVAMSPKVGKDAVYIFRPDSPDTPDGAGWNELARLSKRWARIFGARKLTFNKARDADSLDAEMANKINYLLTCEPDSFQCVLRRLEDGSYTSRKDKVLRSMGSAAYVGR